MASPPPQELGDREGPDGGQGERHGVPGTRRVPPDAAVEPGAEEHAAVVAGAEQPEEQPLEHHDPVGDVREVPGEADRDEGARAEELVDDVDGGHRGRHRADDERCRERLVDLLHGEHDAGEWGLERRGHAGSRAAGDEEAALPLRRAGGTRHGGAAEAAEHDRGALASEGEAAQGAEHALGELGRHGARPGNLQAPEGVGLDLGDAGPRARGRPAHEGGDGGPEDDHDRDPPGDRQGVPGRRRGDGAHGAVREVEGEPEEAHDDPGAEAHRGALDDHMHLEASGEPQRHGVDLLHGSGPRRGWLSSPV